MKSVLFALLVVAASVAAVQKFNVYDGAITCANPPATPLAKLVEFSYDKCYVAVPNLVSSTQCDSVKTCVGSVDSIVGYYSCLIDDSLLTPSFRISQNNDKVSGNVDVFATVDCSGNVAESFTLAVEDKFCNLVSIGSVDSCLTQAGKSPAAALSSVFEALF